MLCIMHIYGKQNQNVSVAKYKNFQLKFDKSIQM